MYKFFFFAFLFLPAFALPVSAFNNFAGDFESSSSQYLSILDASQTGLDLNGGNFTFMAWIKLESQPVTANYNIVSKRAALQLQYRLYYTTSGTTGLSLDLGDTACDIEVQAAFSAQTLQNNRWYHVAATHINGGASEIYLDGIALGAAISGATFNNCTAEFEIGATNGGIQLFDGEIDEVAVFNRLLSPDEIRGYMRRQLHKNETGLQGYWSSENNFRDLTANANNLTNNNSVSFGLDRAFWDSGTNLF